MKKYLVKAIIVIILFVILIVYFSKQTIEKKILVLFVVAAIIILAITSLITTLQKAKKSALAKAISKAKLEQKIIDFKLHSDTEFLNILSDFFNKSESEVAVFKFRNHKGHSLSNLPYIMGICKCLNKNISRILTLGCTVKTKPETLILKTEKAIPFIKEMNITKYYISTKPEHQPKLYLLLTELLENYSLKELKRCRIFFQGDFKTNGHHLNSIRTQIFNNILGILGRKQCLKPKRLLNGSIKTIFAIGVEIKPEPKTLTLKTEQTFPLFKKLNVKDFYINTASKHQTELQQLLTQLAENYSQKKLKESNVYFQGNLDELHPNLKNTLQNSFGRVLEMES